MAVVLLVLAQLDPGFAKLTSSVRLWVGIVIFVTCTATAAFAPWRRVAVAALVLVLLYSLWGVLNAASVLIADGGWAPALGAGG